MSSFRIQFAVVVGCIALFVVFLLSPSRPLVRSVRSYRYGALEEIGMALQSYHSEHGCFPPAYIADSKGRPVHSWRVLLLPNADYADMEDTYESYSFDEAWNSPHNTTLLDQDVNLYTGYRPRSQKAAFVAIVGPGTAWPGPRCISISDLKHGGRRTIQLVEIQDSDIPWLEPRDINIDIRMQNAIATVRDQIFKGGGRDRLVLFCDGTVRFIPRETAGRFLRLVFLSESQQIDSEEWQSLLDSLELKW